MSKVVCGTEDFGNGVKIKTWEHAQGTSIGRVYTLNGKIHKLDGPAWINFHKDSGKPWREEYWINNQLHNENGPAYILYDEEGNAREERYYYLDEQFDSLEDIKKYILIKELAGIIGG